MDSVACPAEHLQRQTPSSDSTAVNNALHLFEKEVPSPPGAETIAIHTIGHRHANEEIRMRTYDEAVNTQVDAARAKLRMKLS